MTGYFRVRIRGVGQAFVDSETIAAAPPLYLPFLNVTTIRVAFLPARSRFRAVPPDSIFNVRQPVDVTTVGPVRLRSEQILPLDRSSLCDDLLRSG